MPQQLEELGFTCGACGKQFRWKPELAGRSVKCKCETTIRVPAEAGGVAQPKVAAATSAAPVGVAAPTARRSTASPSPAIAGTKAARPAAKAPAAAPPPPPAEDDPFAALNALAEQEAGAAEGASETDDAARCPNCRSFLALEAVLCTNCGFDRRKGKVLATTTAAAGRASENRGLFGFGKPKPEGATKQKKEVVDKMAPQGSFVIGLVVSVVLAVLASVLWFGVAYAFDLDVFYLVLLVGAAAGLGMQVGQKGYSTFGGFAAALVALVVILGARVAVVVAVLLPLLRATSGVDSGEDPRVIMSLMDAEYQARGLDSGQTTIAQDEAVALAAEQKASSLSEAEKTQMIAEADRAMATEPEPDIDADADFGMSAIVMLVVFGGVKSFLFLLGALFLAFRTASGSVSG